MPAPVASGWSESPGGPCTHWKKRRLITAHMESGHSFVDFESPAHANPVSHGTADRTGRIDQLIAYRRQEFDDELVTSSNKLLGLERRRSSEVSIRCDATNSAHQRRRHV